MGQYSPEKINQISGLLEIGISLLGEQNIDELLGKILAKALQVTNADAGTLFLRENNELIFEIMRNKSLELCKKEEEIELPNLKIKRDNVAGYVVLEKEILNIADVNNATRFHFTGPEKYDSLTGYHSQSMLVVPMENHEGRIIGVLQLINAQNKVGEIIKFPVYLEKVVSFLASQAAISLSHFWALEEVENLLDSYVQVMATAIDARMPYNASHTQQIVNMLNKMIEVINNSNQGKLAAVKFDSTKKEQLIMAAWLHDIGKLAIPLRIMNKSTRLGTGKLELILQRLDYLKSQAKVNYLESKLEFDGPSLKHKYKKRLALIDRAKRLITQANEPNNTLDSQFKKKLVEIANLTYLDQADTVQPWLTESELQALINSKGTLTVAERKKIESHVQISNKILDQVPFPDKFKDVKDWVLMHHELLDGSGYPKGIAGSKIPLETRVLTVLDIFEALISPERPYKDEKTVEKAVEILDDMVEEGKLDQDLVALFKEEKIWQAIKY
jgi:HD-GYP domain-containing protein (c-di-GMP phosphodiesterase class II)